MIRLLSNRVLIRLLQPERHSHGLWIPETAQRQAHELWRGEVVATGPGKRLKYGDRLPCDVKAGDKVLFNWQAGKIDVTKYPDDEHRIITEDAIQGVFA